MPRLLSAEVLPSLKGKNVQVAGWVHERRDLGGLKFLILKDRAGILQITIPKKEAPASVLKALEGLTKESVVWIEGKVQEASKAPTGVEIVPSKLEVLSLAKAPAPLDTSGKIESDLSKRLDYRFLDLRNPKSLAIFKIRSKMFKLLAEYFDSRGFTNINTPKLTTVGLESGAEVFPVLYFGKEATLAQSPQLYKQMMVCSGFERVYEIAPVYRAEKSNTPRHQTEFIGVDFEMGYIKDFGDVMDTIEDMVKHVLAGLKQEVAPELALWNADLKVPKSIPRVKMSELKQWLAKEKGKKISETDDFDPEAERMVGEIVQKKFGEEFVFATHYPTQKRPFYHMYSPDGKTTDSFDLLWNGVEVATGAQREHRYDILKKQAKAKGIELDSMGFYTQLFQYGAPPHGGVGFGLDRLVQRLLKFDNIREAILLPRDPERLTP